MRACRGAARGQPTVDLCRLDTFISPVIVPSRAHRTELARGRDYRAPTELLHVNRLIIAKLPMTLVASRRPPSVARQPCGVRFECAFEHRSTANPPTGQRSVAKVVIMPRRPTDGEAFCEENQLFALRRN